MAGYDVVQIDTVGAAADAALAERRKVLNLIGAPIPADLTALAPDAKVLVTTVRRGVTRELMAALPALKAVCSWGVGFDTLDVGAAREMSIGVSYTPGVLDDCVADLAFALLLGTARRLAEADRYVRSGSWCRSGAFPETVKVSGKRLGILGMGRIGEAIARRGAGFDMPIGYHNRRPKADAPGIYFDDLAGLATWADVLVVACPGGPATYRLVNAAVLEALGPRGILVNIARGSVVDQAALVAALQAGTLGGAGLDVFEEEPSAPAALVAMDQVVLTPHYGSCTQETRRAMGDLVVANAEAVLDGGALLTPIP
ncbi:lactate dehydrogenase-like oxidoreductase [Stappia sp. 22II-S9-Z10]|nr:lactate dehydrogenase-like oxidoreductase [Stappia sp. 22II-S9-Z10]